MHGRSTL
jgi:hypothetical protein